MSYCRSAYLEEFEDRVASLAAKAQQAMQLSDQGLRDLIFQSTVFLTGAAIETYLKLIIEAWVDKVKAKGRGAHAPNAARAFIALRQLERPFLRYSYDKDEKSLCMTLQQENALWSLLIPNTDLPSFFQGKTLHDGVAYPSTKNIRKLFARVGINNMTDQISKFLNRDAEVLIDSFQSVRTALAHSAPPEITIDDVSRLLDDSKLLVRAIDDVLWRHVSKHGGSDCWPISSLAGSP